MNGGAVTIANFFDTFRTLEEVNEGIEALAMNFPHLVTKKVPSYIPHGPQGHVCSSPSCRSGYR